MPFLSTPQDFLKGWDRRNYKLPAGQEVSFLKTKVSTSSKRENVLTNRNKLKWTKANLQSNCPILLELPFKFILNSVYTDLNNFPKARSKEICENAPSSSCLQYRGLLTATSQKSRISQIKTTVNWRIPSSFEVFRTEKSLSITHLSPWHRFVYVPWW